jgi:hypothetical protein
MILQHFAGNRLGRFRRNDCDKYRTTLDGFDVELHVMRR